MNKQTEVTLTLFIRFTLWTLEIIIKALVMQPPHILRARNLLKIN